VICGFSAAVAIGLPLGVLSGRLLVAHKLMSTTVNALRAVPGITWLPLATVWFGIVVIALIGRLSDQLLQGGMKFCFKSAGRMG
jgi:ABC-type nitrate/sulfonate/bicarbonate transport system permease component